MARYEADVKQTAKTSARNQETPGPPQEEGLLT